MNVDGTHGSQPLDLSVGKMFFDHTTFYPHLIPKRP